MVYKCDKVVYIKKQVSIARLLLTIYFLSLVVKFTQDCVLIIFSGNSAALRTVINKHVAFNRACKQSFSTTSAVKERIYGPIGVYSFALSSVRMRMIDYRID